MQTNITSMGSRQNLSNEFNSKWIKGTGLLFCSKVKGELGELQIYFRKIPLHQQKFWWFRFFLIRLGCREI